MPPRRDAGAAEAVSLNGPKSAGMVESVLPPGDEGGGALEGIGAPHRGQLLMPGWSAVPHDIHCMVIISSIVKVVLCVVGGRHS